MEELIDDIVRMLHKIDDIKLAENIRNIIFMVVNRRSKN